MIRRDFCDRNGDCATKIWYGQTFATKICNFQSFTIEKLSRENRTHGLDGATSAAQEKTRSNSSAISRLSRLKWVRRDQPGWRNQKLPFPDPEFHLRGRKSATFQTKLQTARLSRSCRSRHFLSRRVAPYPPRSRTSRLSFSVAEVWKCHLLVARVWTDQL